MERTKKGIRRHRKRPSEGIVGRLKPADPFELIRWLARSQPDPRKALAELVQNSLDAGARTMHVTRLRERGVATLRIVDDGEGVIPELGRKEALQYVATHIGYSRKRNLTPKERRDLLMQGRYGIGLLGFWAIGETLEMRTQVPGEPPWLLRMHEDSPRFEIERARSRLSFGDRYTEIVVRAMHRSASAGLTARRMSDYLATELRGQILSRNVRILVHDRIARGRAPKVLEVTPKRFHGERLALPETIDVPGFSPARVEFYVVPEGTSEEARVAVSSVGTTVYDDLTDFEGDDFRREPWTDARLAGLVEFPDFRVAPGSRRGVFPDPAAYAFARALREVEPRIREELRRFERRAAEEMEAGLVRQLEKAFRDLPRLAPEYDFFSVLGEYLDGREAIGEASGTGNGERTSDELPEGAAVPENVEEEEGDQPELLRGGGLESLEILPHQTRVERLGRRRLRAVAKDAAGVRIRRDLPIVWSVRSAGGELERSEGRATVFRAGEQTGTVIVVAEASENGRRAEAEATIDVVEAAFGEGTSRAGIPNPTFVDELGGWRSRMRGNEWQVNRRHPDFEIASQSGRRKLRYLAALLGKEIVLHSFPAPQLEPVLERLVSVLTIADRRLERG